MLLQLLLQLPNAFSFLCWWNFFWSGETGKSNAAAMIERISCDICFQNNKVSNGILNHILAIKWAGHMILKIGHSVLSFMSFRGVNGPSLEEMSARLNSLRLPSNQTKVTPTKNSNYEDYIFRCVASDISMIPLWDIVLCQMSLWRGEPRTFFFWTLGSFSKLLLTSIY